LKSKDTKTMKEGDVWVIRSPGAGGYGNPEERPKKLIREDIKSGLIHRHSLPSQRGL